MVGIVVVVKEEERRGSQSGTVEVLVVVVVGIVVVTGALEIVSQVHLYTSPSLHVSTFKTFYIDFIA